MAYSTRADIEAQYGVVNVEKWADLNNNQNAGEITARIDQSIIEADNEIDSRLRLGPFVIPWPVPIPVGIVSLSAIYAGVWLYSSRGVVDYDANGVAQDQLQFQRNEFDKRIRNILAGRYQPESIPDTNQTFPEVVKE